MPNAQNVEMMAAIKEDLQDVNAMWVVDYRGLTVKQIQELRRSIREADASMKVYKNTLMRIAMNEADLPTSDEILEGPSAFIFAKADPVASAKAIDTFAKANKDLVIKGGVMDGQLVDADQVKAVAALPSRQAAGDYLQSAGANGSRAQCSYGGIRSLRICYCRSKGCCIANCRAA